MTEDFLQFIWKHKLFIKDDLISSNGDKLEILHVGHHNQDSGPDFFDARIKLNDVLWAGNVEIHVKSSMWNQHNHKNDQAYDNVILHVVSENDADVIVSGNRILPCLELKFDQKLLRNYNSLMHSVKWIPCYDEISKVERFFARNWMDRIVAERLERKSADVQKILEMNTYSWEETFYHVLVRYFGMKINADPFQQLAQSLPLKVLARQKNSLLQIEALLFGQAGMLQSNDYDDDYYKNLKREYLFLADKYKLKAVPSYRWKWLRLRPANFPTIRIAQLAALIHKSSSLFSKILNLHSYSELIKLFEAETSAYWKNHYQFGVESKKRNKKLGVLAINGLLLNSVVPILFLYGKINESTQTKEKAINLLGNIPAENNSVIEKWKNCGVEVKTAWHTQALLQLKSNYCNQYRCLQCEFGNRIIRMTNCGVKPK